ncbi:MAG TPA: fatty acid desaturase family protein [Polyangiaceae bacterium]|nr:fatty acid desaturase family protein [Polyangiaceae bacterium]
MNVPEPENIRKLLSPEEIRAFTRRSNLAGFSAVGFTWAVIALSFVLLAKFPNPLTFVLVVVVLGGRQLALAILMHEAAHRTLFENRFLNDVLADWLCARPIGNDVSRYKKHHFRHHAKTGTPEDPDLGLAAPFPTTRRSLVRKFARDLLGPTGLKRLVGQWLIDCEVIEYTVSTDTKPIPRGDRTSWDYARAGLRNGGGYLVTNAAMIAVLAAFGHPLLYLAWLTASLTTFNLFIRIRSLAEHACTELSSDPYKNTRTTRAGFLARATVAPIRVNHHLEHHLLVAVPYFRLPAVHRRLREIGLVPAPPSYVDVLRLVSSRPETAPVTP